MYSLLTVLESRHVQAVLLDRSWVLWWSTPVAGTSRLFVDITPSRPIARKAATTEPKMQNAISEIKTIENRPLSNSIVCSKIRTSSALSGVREALISYLQCSHLVQCCIHSSANAPKLHSQERAGRWVTLADRWLASPSACGGRLEIHKPR